MKFVRVTKVIKEISLDESLKHSTSFFYNIKNYNFYAFWYSSGLFFYFALNRLFNFLLPDFSIENDKAFQYELLIFQKGRK